MKATQDILLYSYVLQNILDCIDTEEEGEVLGHVASSSFKLEKQTCDLKGCQLID